jgi:hypothetical protein
MVDLILCILTRALVEKIFFYGLDRTWGKLLPAVIAFYKSTLELYKSTLELTYAPQYIKRKKI